jgi:ribosomal protein S18 acetylase RimI-like enzyme
MPMPPLEISRCPPDRLAEALALVLDDLAPSQRRLAAAALLDAEDAAELAAEPLFVATRGGQIRGAAWGERQSGRIAVFWPPQLMAGEDLQASFDLAEAVVRNLDELAIDMTQVLLQLRNPDVVKVLRHVGFRHLADLVYLTCEAERFPAEPAVGELTFETYAGSQRQRLKQLIERSYDGTLDCTALNGVRDVDDVVNGYQATGVYRAENWLIVRHQDEDVGILLLADHPKARHWELMYMGLVPEVRGHGWGGQITRHAQWLARGANVDRIVLAVDSTNTPAVRTYARSGFEPWDRRSVYVRFPQN